MTIGTLRVILSQPFDNLLNDIRDISSLLDLCPINPSFGKILAWSNEGEEVELEGWSHGELIEKKIQLMSFWNADGSELMVSWQSMDNQWSLGFSEARGGYLMLEKIFGYFARKMSMHPFRRSDDLPAIVFGFE